MTDRERVAGALARHDAFDGDRAPFSVTTTPFEGKVAVGGSDGSPEFHVTVRVPTLDSVVAGETVAPVVREGWLETFELRLEDVGGVTRETPSRPAVRRDEAAGEVVVETTLPAEHPDRAADDAKAVVDFVEGTYVEGVIPGYTYREPVAGLVERARSTGEV